MCVCVCVFFLYGSDGDGSTDMSLVHRDKVVHINAERKVLAAGTSKWIVEMHSTFQDPGNLYIAMEFVPGGDMRTFIIAHGMLITHGYLVSRRRHIVTIF